MEIFQILRLSVEFEEKLYKTYLEQDFRSDSNIHFREFFKVKCESICQIVIEVLNDNNFLILLDGFDEISPELKDNLRFQLLNQFSHVKKSRFLLTSRTGENIPFFSNSKEFEICPLSDISNYELCN